MEKSPNEQNTGVDVFVERSRSTSRRKARKMMFSEGKNEGLSQFGAHRGGMEWRCFATTTERKEKKNSTVRSLLLLAARALLVPCSKHRHERRPEGCSEDGEKVRKRAKGRQKGQRTRSRNRDRDQGGQH